MSVLSASQAIPERSSVASPHESTDRSLLQRFRQGEQEAATHLYKRYVQRLRGLARKQCSPDLASRLDEEDIVQSVFRTFFLEASRGYYEVPAGEDLWNLLLVIALNKIRAEGAYHRAAKRDVRLTSPIDRMGRPVEPAPQRKEDTHTFLRLVVKDALDRLPPLDKRIVELRMHGYDVAEIALETGRSKRTVERLLQAARQQLSVLLRSAE